MCASTDCDSLGFLRVLVFGLWSSPLFAGYRRLGASLVRAPALYLVPPAPAPTLALAHALAHALAPAIPASGSTRTRTHISRTASTLLAGSRSVFGGPAGSSQTGSSWKTKKT